MIWPEGTRESQKEFSLKRLPSADLAISLCKRRGTAVQAGGNVGLWPMRMAETFERVITFEPEAESYRCLKMNVLYQPNIEARTEALGAARGTCAIKRRSLSSHTVIPGEACTVLPLDDLDLTDVDLLQLDVEGYEMEALKGARRTIEACRPIIQLELRDFTEKYGSSDDEVRALLTVYGYRQVAQVPGSDFVFRHGG